LSCSEQRDDNRLYSFDIVHLITSFIIGVLSKKYDAADRKSDHAKHRCLHLFILFVAHPANCNHSHDPNSDKYFKHHDAPPRSA
jgi:hypothetical protein